MKSPAHPILSAAEAEYRSGHGSIILFLALALPIIMLALSLSYDLKRTYRERRMMQDVADGASLVAAKNLPFMKLAERRAHEYMKLYGMAGAVGMDVKGKVLVTIRRPMPLVFSRYFREVPAELMLTVKSMAMNSPRDVVIYLDTSSYMGPSVIYARYSEAGVLIERRPLTRGEAGWGNNKDKKSDDGLWPAADLFKQRAARFEEVPLLNPMPPEGEPKGGSQIAPLLATQQCFNPGFSAMKEAAIRAYDYFSASPLTRVAVMAGPNDDLDVGIVHPLESAAEVSERGEFGYYRSLYSRDEYCLKAAEYEWRHSGYQVPPIGADFGSRSLQTPGGDLVIRNPDALVVKEQNWILPTYHRPSVREVLWSKAVQRGYSGHLEQFRTASISKILTAVGSTLLSVPQDRARGALAENASHTALILLGDLPYEYDEHAGRYRRMTADRTDPVRAAFKDALQHLNAEAARLGVALSIFITSFKHYGNYPQCPESGQAQLFECWPFFADTQPFEEFAQDLRLSHTKVTVLRVPDFGTMGQEFAALIPLIGNSSYVVR